MADINDIRITVLNVARTYTCMGQYNEMIAFFSDASHNQACIDAYKLYGMPPKNGIDNDGNYHADWCSWDLGMYKYFLLAKLYYRYPSVDITNNNNCKKIDEQIKALEVEKLNLDKEYTADQNSIKHSYQLYVVNDLQSILSAAFANMSCANVINQANQQQTIQTLTSVTEESSTTNTNQNSVVTVIAVIVVIVIIIKIFKS